jgi:hypothetical protein
MLPVMTVPAVTPDPVTASPIARPLPELNAATVSTVPLIDAVTALLVALFPTQEMNVVLLTGCTGSK